MRLPLTFFLACLFGHVLANPLDTIAPPAIFAGKGAGGGGATYSPGISPHDPENIFLVCDMAGVYRTADAGHSWSLYPYGQLASSIKAQVQFTSDPNVLYTIHRPLAYEEIYRAIPKKSADGGASWQNMTDPTATGVHRLFADPASTQRILLNEYDRLFFSNNGGTSFTEVYNPGGLVWLGGVFWDGNNIYVGTGQGLLVSHDGGASFAIETHAGLPAGTGIFLLTGAKEGGVTKLFSIPVDENLLAPWADWRSFNGEFQGLFGMTYAAGAAWSNARGNIPANHEIKFADLAQDEKDTLYAVAHLNDWTYVYKTVNGGSTWTNTFLTANNQNIATGVASEQGIFSYFWMGGGLGFDVSPTDPNVLIFTNYGFPHLSYDGGATWRQTYVDTAFQHPPGTAPLPGDFYQTNGLNLTSTHHIHWVDEEKIFLASTDIGNQFSQDGGQSWTYARNVFESWGSLKDNNWYVIAKHPTNGILYGVAGDLNDIYLEYRIADYELNGTGKLLTSADTGQTWAVLHDFGHPVVWFVQDPEQPSRMFASVVHHVDGGIFRSENGGSTWSKLTLPARTQGHPYTIRLLGDGDLVATFSARKIRNWDDTADSLSASSGVFYSADNGNSWSDRSAAGMFQYAKDIAVSPHDPAGNTWFVSVWGGLYPTYDSNGGVYRTTDRGLNWTKIFSHKRAESLAPHPFDANVAYLATEDGGLFRTGNLSGGSPTFSAVVSFPYPRPKRIFFNPHRPCEIWVTTMGGAVWVGTEAAFTASVAVTPGTYCQGASTTLTASPGVSWSWSNGLDWQAIPVSPAQTTTYFVTVTDANGCTATASAVADPVNQDPVVLTAASGSFSDGSGINNYLDLTLCTWLIQPPGAVSITLNFSEFLTEEGWDFVRIYDGTTTAAPLLGEFSGTSLPPQVASTGGSMRVVFETDYALNHVGWSANYQACLADLTVGGNPVAPGIYRAGNSIVSSGLVAGTVEFQAGMEVRLEAGFEVQAGATFFAGTGTGCQ